MASTLKFTDEQARAITQRETSVALSAGAGCGKTFVLTERFLTHLEPTNGDGPNPADLSELIAITFTERAAREMRDRIRLKCYDRLKAAKGEDAKYWLTLLRAIDRARVSTIHSFCATLLRSHAVEAEIDPSFAVMEQAQAETIIAELIDDHLRSGLSSLDELTLGLVADFGLERLRSCILSLLNSWNDLDSERWQAMTPEEQVEIWAQFHQKHVVPLLVQQVGRAPAATEVLEILTDADISHPVMIERKAVLCDLLTGLGHSKNPAGDLETAREAAKVQGAGGKKDWGDEELYNRYKEAASKLRAEIDKAKKHLDFDPQAALPAAEAGLRLFRFTVAIAEAYDARKRELGCLDFGDLMYRAQKLLCDPRSGALRKKLSSQIHTLLVDEFQDTDPLQVELVKALCGEGVTQGKLFFVGDFKQSIYRFRGADPQVFRQLQDVIPTPGRLPLTLNFRSQPAILDFVNAMFSHTFGDSYEPLRASRPQVTQEKSIEFLWAKLEDEALEKGRAAEMRRCEADWIARRLRAMLDSGEELVFDHEAVKRGEPQARPVKLGDIAILFRALSDVHYYEEALQAYGIDYYLVGGHAFYAQQEIYDLLNLLRALVSPCDQVSLAGALRSPFFALSDEALFWLGQHHDGLAGGLFAEELPEQLDEAMRRRVFAAAQTLRELRACKDRMPISQLINEALARTGYDAVLLAEFLGERKLANLRKLIDQARSFDSSGVMGLSDFIVQLSRFVVEQPREPLAATHPESTDVVRLMTIHQSKGLEFPVVVVPDMERASHGHTDSVAVSSHLGPLVRHDRELPTCGLDLHRLVSRAEDQEELVRLFYVACTRAADYLILSSSIANLEKPSGDWTQLLARRFDLATGELIGELADGYAMPGVRVTSERPKTTFKRRGRAKRKNLESLIQKAVDLSRSSKRLAPSATRPLVADHASRRQYSFSRLTGKIHAQPKVWSTELAEGEEMPSARIDPLGLGTLTHAVLEKITHTPDEELPRLVEELAPQHFENPEEAVAMVTEWVTRFARSPRAADLKSARAVYPELEFLLAWPPDAPQEEGLYLQGFIDCLYQDAAGRWHVLDYKTNRVSAGDLARTAKVYEMQLYVYALAAEQVLGEPPADLILNFLQPGEESIFAWNDRARKRLAELVNSAIAESVEQGGDH